MYGSAQSVGTVYLMYRVKLRHCMCSCCMYVIVQELEYSFMCIVQPEGWCTCAVVCNVLLYFFFWQPGELVALCMCIVQPEGWCTVCVSYGLECR